MSDLPAPGTPLTLADGRVVDPKTGRVSRPDTHVAVPNNEQAKQLVVNTRKKLVDLPETPARMNILGALVSYDLIGLDRDEIGVALGISAEQVNKVMESDSFIRFREEIIAALVASQSDNVRGIVNGTALNAARRLTDLVNSDDDSIALAASKDVLDRDGHRPADVVEHRHSMEGGLVIRYVDDSPSNVLDGVVLDGDILDG